jgi:glycine/D-amino acid oxidase-like deaminating enzyme
MNKSYDVIIIGGGIIGTASAFHLAKKGVKVALLEQRFIGDGPTGKSSAIIRQHYSNELTARNGPLWCSGVPTISSRGGW